MTGDLVYMVKSLILYHTVKAYDDHGYKLINRICWICRIKMIYLQPIQNCHMPQKLVLCVYVTDSMIMDNLEDVKYELLKKQKKREAFASLICISKPAYSKVAVSMI